MAKPTSIPTWATDPGATADPGATRTATGFITGKKAPAKWFNWLFNRTGAWFSYLDNLHNEPEFLNKNYSWTGVQKLAMGYIANHWGVSGEVLYANPTTGAPELRSRTVKIPLSAYATTYYLDSGERQPAWAFYHPADDQAFWEGLTNANALIAFYHLPHHSVISSVRAGVNLGGVLGGHSIEMTVGLYSDLEGFTGSDHLSSFTWGTPVVNTTGGGGVMTAYPPSHEIDGTIHTLAVRFRGLTPGGGQFRVYWSKVVFDDPGPRNF